MRTLYLDCFAGIAGDMFLGALLDLGLDQGEFLFKLKDLGLTDYAVSIKRGQRGGISGFDVSVSQSEGHHHHHGHDGEQDDGHSHGHSHDENMHFVDVEALRGAKSGCCGRHKHHGEGHHHGDHECCGGHGDHHGHHDHDHHHHDHQHHSHGDQGDSSGHVHRGLKEILEMIGSSGLSPWVKENSSRAFGLLAEVEASIHGKDVEEVHFHEVGAVDSIVDIVGAFVLLEMLDVQRVCASAVNVGSGRVKCAHGIMPVPAPATARLLEGIPVFSKGEPMERTTPTGALILRCIVDSFGDIPSGRILASGYGLGDRITELPNFLRALLIEEEIQDDGDKKKLPYSYGKVAVLETNVDDMNPQDCAPLMDVLFESGALDVFLTPILMKKGRSALRVTCICPIELREEMGRLILKHSTSIGVRFLEEERMTLRRKIQEFEAREGMVRFKIARWGDEVFNVAPEFEDLRRISLESGIPLPDLRNSVVSQFYGRGEGRFEG